MATPVIVAAARTPTGRAFKGSLIDMRGDDLAVVAVKATLAQVPELDPNTVEDLMLGTAQPAGGQGFNMGRVVAIMSGMPNVPGTTLNRFCSSSLQTIRMAAHAITAREGDVFIAAGTESTSHFKLGNADGVPNTHNPLFADAEARSASRLTPDAADWTEAEGLADVSITMIETAENVAQHVGLTRKEMDEFAALSQNRAEEAQEADYFHSEIAPVTLPDGTVVTKDDSPRHGTTVERLAELKPVFFDSLGGKATVTAGNACPFNDGGAAVIVMSDTRAKDLGITPLARIVSSGLSGLNPEIMGLGPIDASTQALKRAKMTINDIDLVEINEAFAAQVIPCARALNIPYKKLNVRGGAIALGHPFGQSGARIMTTLLHHLRGQVKTFGLESMCVGGGPGMAMIVERLN